MVAITVPTASDCCKEIIVMTELEPGLALSAGGSYWFYSLCGYLASSPSLKVRTSPERSLDSCYLSRVWPPLGSPELGLVEFFLFQTIESPHFGVKGTGGSEVRSTGAGVAFRKLSDPILGSG